LAGSQSEAAGSPVMVNAVKLAEDSDEIIIRVRELTGRAQENVNLVFDRPIVSAREVNGVEEEVGPAQIVDGRLAISLKSYQPKAFAVILEPLAINPPTRPLYAALSLPYNLDAISMDDDRCNGDFDGHGYSLAGELIPDTLNYLGIPFVFGPKQNDAMNAVKCEGQRLALPQGSYNRLYLLTATVDGPAETVFAVDDRDYDIALQDYADPLGQWDNRLIDSVFNDSPEEITPTYINRLPVAWYGSHRHTPDCRNDAYRFTYLFQIELEIPSGAGTVIFPRNHRIRILAATLADKPYADIRPAQPLYDEGRNTFARFQVDSAAFATRCVVTMDSPIPATTIRYTLDGTDPTVESDRYTRPVIVDRTATIKARAFKPGYNAGYVAAKTVVKLDPVDAVEVQDLRPGLKGQYYEGEWKSFSDFDTLEVVRSFIAESVAIPEFARKEHFGLAFEGFVEIPQDEVYSFSITSDDGSRLYVADTLLVDHDGIHMNVEKTGRIGLKAGFHRLAVYMFQNGGDEGLSISVSGPSLPKQPIPAYRLFH
jgi:alpha-mannosidase